jgi:hypothetical protein
MATKRNYKREYELYQGTPEQLRNQALRHKARREYEKKHGTLPDNVDVAHKKALSKGGSPAALSNLKAESRSGNRSFARTANNKLKSEVSKREKSR